MATLIGASEAIIASSAAPTGTTGRCGPGTDNGYPYVVDSFGRTVGPRVMSSSGYWLGTATCGAVWPVASAASYGTTTGGVNGSALYLATGSASTDGVFSTSLSIPATFVAYGADEVFTECRWRFTVPPATQNSDFVISLGPGLLVYIAFTNNPGEYQGAVRWTGPGTIVGDVDVPPNTYAFTAGTWYRTRIHLHSGVRNQMSTWADGGPFPGWQFTQTLHSNNTASVVSVGLSQVFVSGGPGSFQMSLIEFTES
jgi:hypothetical protein